MTRAASIGAVLVLILLPALTRADNAPVAIAAGTVAKVDKDTLTIRPRGPDGKFDKELKLKLTGTSKITTLAPQTRQGKTVIVQRDTVAQDLQQKQTIAVIYANDPAGPVLLSAVAEPVSKK